MSLSEPHTSDKNGTSVVFIKIYMEMWINDVSIMHSQTFMFKELGYKLDSLQMLPNVCLSCEQLLE